jgi:predicted GNAT family acetyltransferase
MNLLREYIRGLLSEAAQAQTVTYDRRGRPEPTSDDMAFMKEYESLTEENPIGMPWDRYWYMGEIDGKHCLVITNIRIDFNRGGIYFNSIQTVPPEVCEGQGFASKVMNSVTDLADKHGVSLRLLAVPFAQKSVSGENLSTWYSRAGFEQTDPDYGEVMVRQSK